MKSVLLTGITGGLGLELARALGKDGWKVYGVCRHLDGRSENLSSEFKKQNWPLQLIACDFNKTTDVEKLVTWCRQFAPELDAFIHAAAPPLDLLPFWKESVENFYQQFFSGAAAAVIICRELVRPFSQKSNSHIILIGSTTTLGKAAKGMASYTVGKYALLGLAQALHSEYSHKISIQLISPSTMDTGLLKKLPDAAKSMMVSGTPEKRFTPISKVVEAVQSALKRTQVPVEEINVPVI